MGTRVLGYKLHKVLAGPEPLECRQTTGSTAKVADLSTDFGLLPTVREAGFGVLSPTASKNNNNNKNSTPLRGEHNRRVAMSY